jgi:hypothetical protein
VVKPLALNDNTICIGRCRRPRESSRTEVAGNDSV